MDGDTSDDSLLPVSCFSFLLTGRHGSQGVSQLPLVIPVDTPQPLDLAVSNLLQVKYLPLGPRSPDSILTGWEVG